MGTSNLQTNYGITIADPNLERVASLKTDGYTNEEIAKMIDRTRRTAQRMLDLIRDLWREKLNASS